MANTKAKANGHYSLDKYVKEAEGEPFVLDLSADRSLTIEPPTGDQMFDAEAAMGAGDSRAVISALCGDAAKELLAVTGPMNSGVIKGIAKDLADHFGLGE